MKIEFALSSLKRDILSVYTGLLGFNVNYFHDLNERILGLFILDA